ncbi:MAG: hypothetical protein R8M38_10000 [Mariprofundaceae bacterium]
MNDIRSTFILPSAAITVPRSRIKHYSKNLDHLPKSGDLIYGVIEYVGQHAFLENKEGRRHSIYDGTRAIFVVGNRYSPDYYEGFVPSTLQPTIDLLSQSGLVGEMRCKSTMVGDPTRVRVLGFVCDQEAQVINTTQFSKIAIKRPVKPDNRAKMILSIGTAMNSGKSVAAAACCWGLSSMGHTVNATKVTGTASLKDILLMEDNGASQIADFTHMGHPSSYMMEENDLLDMFCSLDVKFASTAKNYWVVEFADGILQRETEMLLRSEIVRSRIDKLIFCAQDTFGAIGGLKVLKEEFDLVPDAISGVCSSSPLGVRELQRYTDLPIFNSIHRDLKQLANILV